MGKKKHDEEPGGGEGWLVSYCDMISLLVTFFLMMMTFSTKETGDVSEVGIGILKGKGGMWPKLMGRSAGEPLDPSVIQNLAVDLLATDSASEGGAPSTALKQTLDGISVRFSDDCSFLPGSATPVAALRAQLERVGAIMGRYPLRCVVEGWGDDDFAATPAYPSNEALACARARAAAAIVRAQPGVEDYQLQLAGLGKERPRSTADTAVGRRANRRIELRLLAVMAPNARIAAQEYMR